MNNKDWQLQESLQAIIFDFDSTLVTLEGVDELARFNGFYETVHQLTGKAMGQTGLNKDLYDKRLRFIEQLKMTS